MANKLTGQGIPRLSQNSTFQDLILTLQAYWAKQGCLILQPFDMEVGAGTGAMARTRTACSIITNIR